MTTELFELRQYTLVPGGLDPLVEVFEGELVGPQEDAGMRLHGRYEDLADRDRFVWMRSFPSDDARTAACTAFYTGPVWQQHRDAANATMLDSDDVLLLREPWPGSSAGRRSERMRRKGPFIGRRRPCGAASDDTSGLRRQRCAVL